MKTIVVQLSIPETQIQQIREIVPDWEIISTSADKLDEDTLRRAEIMIGWSSKAETACLDGDSNLRWIHSWGAGVDRMPLEKLQAKDVILTNASGVHAYPISETIFGLILALARKIHTNVYNQRDHSWQQKSGLPEIHGKTMGLLGVGAIGEETARLAKAFNMKVIAFRRSGSPSPYVDEMVDKQGLAYLASECDYLVNTLPLTSETRHMVNSDVFSKMRPEAFYINIGRGGTTDTKALIEAVKTGCIAGAGLDVFEQEPLPEDSPLWDMREIIILPHESGLTEFYNQRALDIFLDNLKKYSSGARPTRNLVDLSVGY